MKFWIKIIVALSVVLVTGFCVWAFCFKEKDEVQAYNNLSEMVDYKESLGIREKMLDLRSMNYVNGNEEKVIGNDTDTEKKIHEVRANLISDTPIVGEREGGVVVYTYNSYIVTDSYLDDIIEYYLPYTKGDFANSKTLKALKRNIKDYNSSLETLQSRIDELMKYQNYIEGEEIQMDMLLARYNSLYADYRTSLNKGASLVLSMLDYIDVSIYSNNIIVDLNMALSDAFARSLLKSSSVTDTQAPDFANDLYMVEKKISEVQNDVDVFTSEYSEYDFLSSYNLLYNNYKDTLNYVFSSKNQEKNNMADGGGLNSVYEKAKQAVVNILNVLGF
ncbi:MAG: hypothetical protein IJW59_03710 [Clostridia bacterium]|nr:hypothetical protein [Clostridia bacterium]